ncbi:MAG: sugar-binding protein [Anaerolineales bacterium]
MEKIKFRHFIVAIIVLSALTACTLPGFSTPTPFSFPTPDKTMTALFEPTQAAPATSAATVSEEEIQKTATEAVPSETPKVEETEAPPTETGEPTKTIDPTVSYVGPSIRSGPSIRAYYMNTKPTIDGDLSEWAPPIQKVINHVVYGAANHSGDLDSSGTVVVGWNEDYLFLGFRVKDDKYVQEGAKEKIYLGDSIEISFDRYVSYDYYLQAMTSDDYQIGISPGKGGISCFINNGKVASMPLITTGPPEAYKWFPKTEAGVVSGIKIAAKKGGEGYQVEMKIPWSVLGVTNPSTGDHFGFALSINDNDKAGTLNQQTVVSNVPGRYFADPTTWGDLYLK